MTSHDDESLFAKATSSHTLSRAWAKIRANGGGPGGDSQTLEDFSEGAGKRIERLSRDLRSGHYRPGPLRYVDVAKSNGRGSRRLSIPSVSDRVAQSATAMVLSNHLEPHFEDASYGYRPGRSVQMAVDRVAALRRAGFHWVIDADIRAFFDEVPHGPLLESLAQHGVDPQLVELVELWLESFGDRGLAQGSPVSPVLANLYLDALDEAFSGENIRIVRFADDFLLLTKSEKRAHRALDRVKRVLADYGLVLHPEKTRLCPFEDAFTFLGRKFVRSLVVREIGSDPVPPPKREIVPSPPEPGLDAPRRLPAALPDGEAYGLSPGLAPLYVMTPRSVLDAAGEGFEVRDPEGVVQMRLPAREIGRIDLGPAVDFTPEALRNAGAAEIPVTFLDGHGAAQSVFHRAPGTANASLHMAQARVALEPEAGLSIARAIVHARLRNQHALLKRLNRNRDDEKIDQACKRLFYLRRKADHGDGIDTLRGYEGQAGRIYWPALARCYKYGGPPPGRQRNPAKDAINAIYNWTASLLTRDVRAAALRARLHAGFGVLHVPGDYRDACVYDLIEAFRAPLAEGLTVYLFNNRILSSTDFESVDDGVRLSGGAGRPVIETYEAWMARRVKSPRSGRRTSWRNLILEDAYGYARSVENETEFVPYHMDY